MRKGNYFNFDNAKTSKGLSLGYRTAILYMTPSRHEINGKIVNSCTMSNKACETLCLAKSGHGMKPIVKNARLERSKMFYENNDLFLKDIEREIKNHIKYSAKKNLIPVVRMNGTTDLNFFNIVRKFPNIIFYEYTKNIEMALNPEKPENLHYTFSYSGTNFLDCLKALENNINVAMVFERNLKKPLTLLGYELIDGNNHDLRFLDDKGKIVALDFKAMMPKSATEKIPSLKRFGFLIGKDEIKKLEFKKEIHDKNKKVEVAI